MFKKLLLAAVATLAVFSSAHATNCETDTLTEKSSDGDILKTGVTVGGVAATAGGVSTGTGGSYNCTLFYLPNTSLSGTVSIVATFTGSPAGMATLAENWAGDAASPFDAMNATASLSFASGTSLPSGNFTTTGSSDTVETMLFDLTGAALTPPPGYTVAMDDRTAAWTSAFKTGVAAGVQNPTWVTTVATGTAAFNMAAGWKAPAAGEGTGHNLIKMDVGK